MPTPLQQSGRAPAPQSRPPPPQQQYRPQPSPPLPQHPQLQQQNYHQQQNYRPQQHHRPQQQPTPQQHYNQNPPPPLKDQYSRPQDQHGRPSPTNSHAQNLRQTSNHGHSPPVQASSHRPPPFSPGRPSPTSIPPLSPAPPDLVAMFHKVDIDGTGALTEKELSAALVNGDYTPFDIETVRMMIRMFDADRSGSISFDEFRGLLSFLDEWRKLFDLFDVDNSRNISLPEFTDALIKFNYRLSPQFVELLFHTYDKRQEGAMSFDLFIQACIWLKRMTDVFKKYDVENPGNISLPKFTDALLKFDYRLSPKFTELLFRTYNKNNESLMSFDLFMQACIWLKRMTEVFEKYDANHSNKIALSEFIDALIDLRYDFSLQFAQLIFSSHDDRREGVLSLDSFLQASLSLKRITDVFKKYDDDRVGCINIRYEDFVREIVTLTG
ncbi:EF-hand domain pair domain-containing protein [Cordyceps javanica]|uniref:EF-hand domain pair domain-containing protein n=1 Tax=Cordyceps javanica TaxID=43265 RepID=A0A545W3P0_9HYPO|nr:EF-hand domain pair domain-containing protein [Cordyceps javanica]TQW08556.1 EF-hand domain pair domain-containing protein [Cordyceps javanica]